MKTPSIFFRRRHVDEYNPHDWWGNLLEVRGSLLREIFGRVLVSGVWALGVVFIDHHYTPLAINATAHLAVGSFLGLMLAFRTNACYDRFWEGRRMWGAINNECRNLSRLSATLLADEPVLLTRIVHWLVAFPWATMHLLRSEQDIETAVTARLPPDEVAQVKASAHIPLAVCRRITATLDEARRRGVVSDYLFATLDNNVQRLVGYAGACERIHRTPLPFAYVVHLQRALLVYCLTLPFALLPVMGWATLPATLLISYILLGIEEIGVQIEDPFGHDPNDLPLERYCARIQGVLEDVLTATLPSSTPSGATQADVAPMDRAEKP